MKIAKVMITINSVKAENSGISLELMNTVLEPRGPLR